MMMVDMVNHERERKSLNNPNLAINECFLAKEITCPLDLVGFEVSFFF